MAATTPRRSSRIPHTHTPKMSERKKGLFVTENESSRESLTKHRRLPVVDSESDSEDCDLGIISTLDSSSGDDTDQNKTPERSHWNEIRNKTKIRETHDLKNFMKSPFTLKKYQTRYSCPETRCTGSLSTPATPHLQNHPRTPSSTHSCASIHTTSSTSSRARKSLASLIADTESCSSSLKDLNFDTDSGSDSKENTPTKSLRRSGRRHKMTPKLQSFKGILVEQKKNMSPMKNAVVCLTKIDMSNYISPTQMLKTPHNTSEKASPPKLGHNRRSVIEIQESPESVCESEKSHKRLHYDNDSDVGPVSKYPRLDVTAPKARLSLFNCDRLKEILSTKSFYGKTNPEMNSNISTKISNAIEATSVHRRHSFSHSQPHRRKRKPGQINLGVKHKIRKPKVHKTKIATSKSSNATTPSVLNQSSVSNKSINKDLSILSQGSTDDKADPFDKEKQTIDALLSQWTEEDIPESELTYTRPQELPCFNSTVIEATDQIFKPITAVPVAADSSKLQDSEAVIVELGITKPVVAANTQNDVNATNPQNDMNATNPQNDQDVIMEEGHIANHGEVPKTGQYLPVEGGYIYVDGNLEQKEIPDLDEIERELQMLDEQILKMAQTNNIDADAVLASTETLPIAGDLSTDQTSLQCEKQTKLFPIFSKPNHGLNATSTKGDKTKRCLLKSGSNQYLIDAGQKKFGATQCHECGVIYEVGDPQDEHDHLVHHNASDVLKFNGWKEECIVDRTEHGRCLRVRGGDSGWRKVEAVLARVVHPQLGYTSHLPGDARAYTAYLYIEKKQIVGCLIVEPKSRAFKLLPGDPDCCTIEDYPVKCGVSRVWTHANFRRRGVAVRLLECARASFLYGCGVLRSEIAFSAPTAAGKALATKYCGTENFYVYLD
ncbi:N-acetyltransferase ESCO2 [Danaus plexippus plexippus]|uniref:N-acetyltransferase ESCO2 n=1 Tax=Danaus plexippus plexippus TaxID=278856 RepID=A0A212ELJ2_DANPL|nr:N-acetyltransferase ESCO2 [Danaus plexippus plexippus]